MPRRKPPSRTRYETEHPSLTVRVPAEVKAQVLAAARAEDLSVSEWVQAMAAGHAADAGRAYARGLAEGRAQGRKAQAILDAAVFWSRHGAKVGDLRDGWTDHLAADWAGALNPDESALLRAELQDRPNLADSVRRWLRERGLPVRIP
jgi:hypothetical protein